jgi:hypothetical protein
VVGGDQGTGRVWGAAYFLPRSLTGQPDNCNRKTRLFEQTAYHMRIGGPMRLKALLLFPCLAVAAQAQTECAGRLASPVLTVPLPAPPFGVAVSKEAQRVADAVGQRRSNVWSGALAHGCEVWESGTRPPTARSRFPYRTFRKR